MNKRIYITGRPGTGKSSLVKEFTKRGIVAYGIDEIDGLCSWTDSATGENTNDYIPVKSWLTTHEWICDIEQLKHLISSEHQLIIITGVARNQDQFIDLFDKIFLLECPQETLNTRLIQRQHEDGNRFGEHQEEREYIIDVFKDFEAKTINQGAITIDCSKPLEQIADDIIDNMQ